MSKKITQFPGNKVNKGFRPGKTPNPGPAPVKMVNNVEIDNSAVVEMIKVYREDKSTENLNKLISELVKATLFIPAIVREDKTPAPKLMKTMEGDTYLGIITDKDQIPEDQREGVLLVVPYLVCNKMAINPVDNIKGIAINPFTDNFIIQRPLLERIEEVENKKKEAKENGADIPAGLEGLGEIVTDENGNKSIKMNEKQYNQFERTQFEVGFIPNELFTKGQEFIDKLLNERETYVDEMFEESYKEKRMYPFLPEDFSVMPMTLSESLTIIRIDMPERDVLFGNCYRVYISWDSEKAEGRYFRITQGKEKGQVILEEVKEGKKVLQLGEAPVEGTELSVITEMVGYVAPEE